MFFGKMFVPIPTHAATHTHDMVSGIILLITVIGFFLLLMFLAGFSLREYLKYHDKILLLFMGMFLLLGIACISLLFI